MKQQQPHDREYEYGSCLQLHERQTQLEMLHLQIILTWWYRSFGCEQGQHCNDPRHVKLVTQPDHVQYQYEHIQL
ncbi:expressed protein [Batrachochytrium dendrobatidis JAM81]|uniref:Expressed protein n=1 Tax=Batrachochytrium dendrobatidis (strain JAM81 / FGSC 10211) TaxID=684364 RepID=F4NRH0_BATDJ|nr:uncharacterized protein BATDEDRAFT_31171 [Batrachochytrium dendrobatidis JAM81]EGF83339.1 expressed protein [Batrachochytrium dendrobatidis JAM81]|eukprot:XP_006675651.1 expressed protein [Batrachochytrium dendrobatidis JAM81]